MALYRSKRREIKKRHSGNIPADLNLVTPQFNSLPSSVRMRPKYHYKTLFRIATAFISVCHRNCPRWSLDTPDYRIEINEKHILHLKGVGGADVQRPTAAMFVLVGRYSREALAVWMNASAVKYRSVFHRAHVYVTSWPQMCYCWTRKSDLYNQTGISSTFAMNILTVKVRRSIPVTAWPKAWVCGRSLA